MRLGLILLAAVAVALPAAADQTPYAGQQSRAIKALSEDDIAALRNGEGMGYAKAAELNSYPGPRHALDLAAKLGLSEDQVRRVTAIHERMNAAARELGAALIERERALDALFAERTVTPENLRAETAAIGGIQARLRAVHLAAHVETRAIFSADQVARYNRLRGYDGPAAGHGHRH